ncbi:hypothetical protein [Nocardia sp. NPDC004260]
MYRSAKTVRSRGLRTPIAALREWIETNINRIEAARRAAAL